MATIFVRGSNPVWSFVDLQGKQFDDTFFMFVLDNEVPYIPVPVYHDDTGTTPWTDPIQFLANGTLPIDIFWDPDVVYRLEFRQGNTQNDPLIYLVENYAPGNGGNEPVGVGIFTENQITNPQFSILSLNPAFTLTATDPDPIQVAPGWFLELTGSGTVVINRLAINSAVSMPTNAPYALQITLTGAWTGSPALRQRFNQSGTLWSNKYVSSSVTARITGSPQSILAQLVDSMGSPLVNVLDPTPINDSFNEYTGFGLVPASGNTDIPPDAYIDYKLILPTTVDIYLTSFQVIASDIANVFNYEQDTIERQEDHTFHYYRAATVSEPKNSILTGWNFSLNPFQFNPTAFTTATSQTQYICDQTIIHQKSGSSKVETGQGIIANRNILSINALGAVTANQFALIQYIPYQTIKPYWSYLLSSLVRARIFTVHNSQVGIKMRLIYSASSPATISPTEPISSWTLTDPVFSGSWTAISPENDPVYILPNAYEDTNLAFPAFEFNGFQMPTDTSSTMSLGIVIYTTGTMNSTGGTEDHIGFDRISLVQNEFALDCQPQTFDEVLRECQFFYEKSFRISDLPLTATFVNSVYAMQFCDSTNISTVGSNGYLTSFQVEYSTKCNSSPAITFYSPLDGSPNAVDFAINYQGTNPARTAGAITTNPGNVDAVASYTQKQLGPNRAFYQAVTSSLVLRTAVGAATNNSDAYINYHFTCDSRLGI